MRTRRAIMLGLLGAAITLGSELSIPSPAGSVTLTPASGAVDASFGTDGYSTVALGTWAGASAVAVQPDGKIVTAGEAEVNGRNVIVSTRMLLSGQLDPSYGSGGIVTVPIGAGAGVDSGAGIALEPNGDIVLAGGGRSSAGPIGFAAVRLLPDGSPDPGFGVDGVSVVPIGSEAIANAVVIEPDGAIALAGSALVGQDEFAAVRLNADGTLDQSFGTGGIVTLPTPGAAWGMVVQPDGRLVLGGQSKSGSTQVMVAIRLLANGAPDPSFGSGGNVTVGVGSEALGYAIALQPTTGKIILAGSAVTSTGEAVAARLNSNGSLDQSFGAGGLATVNDWQGVNGIVLDSQGRIVLPAVGPSAIRINANGSPDTSFGTGAIAPAPLGTRGGANGAAIEPNGEIVLAGAAEVNGQVVLAVTRLFAGAPPATVNQTVGSTVTGGLSAVEGAGTVAAPKSTVRPGIAGADRQGQPMSATSGRWNGAPTKVAYTWQRCDARGRFCADITAADRRTYVPTLLDVGHALRVVVTAANLAGATAASSSPSAAIVGAASAPALSRVSVSPRRVRRGRTVRLSLTISEPSLVTVVIRRAGARRARLRFSAAQGRDSFKLRIAGLRPARYTVEVRATDSAGHVSRVRRLRLVVKRR